MTRMTVRGLLTRDGCDHPVAVLESVDGDATLAFAIPLDEAHRLARALAAVTCSKTSCASPRSTRTGWKPSSR